MTDIAESIVQETPVESSESEVKSQEKASEGDSSTKPQHIKEPTLQEEIKKITSALRTNPLYSEVSYLLHWRDPIRTGLLFGIFNFTFFLITYGEYSVVTLAAYLVLALLVAAFGYANGSILYAKYIQGLSIENPLSVRWSNSEPIPRYVAEKHLNSLVNVVNAVLEISRDVFYVNFPILSIKVASIFLVLSLLGKWFSGLTLIYIDAIILFAWPRLYEEKQKEIDQYWKLINTHIDTYVNLALSKIPKLDKRKTQ
jgi:hypothetical protein